MKFAEAILAAGLASVLTGCVLRGGTPKTVQAAPATPKPAVAPAPAPPPPNLSTPQTHVELPPPQPISEEARATLETTPEEPTPAPSTPKPPRNRPAQAPRTTTETPAQAAPVGPAAPEPTPERPPVHDIVPEEEQRQLQANAQHDRQEANKLLERAATHSLNKRQQQLKRSVESFLQLSADAEKRGDLRQARELAGRAAVLAKELQP